MRVEEEGIRYREVRGKVESLSSSPGGRNGRVGVESGERMSATFASYNDHSHHLLVLSGFQPLS